MALHQPISRFTFNADQHVILRFRVTLSPREGESGFYTVTAIESG
jgi:hypothetical protein